MATTPMTSYQGRRIFRTATGMIVLFVIVTMLFAAGAALTYRQNGWDWVSIGLALATLILGVGSIVESLVLRIELTDDALIVIDLQGRHRYSIADIDGISEAKGVPPALRLKDGRSVKLPSVGNNLGNSVRAWLRR